MYKKQSSVLGMHRGASRHARPFLVFSACVFVCANLPAVSALAERQPQTFLDADIFEITNFDFVQNIHRAHIRKADDFFDFEAFERERNTEEVSYNILKSEDALSCQDAMSAPEDHIIIEEETLLTFHLFIPEESRLSISTIPMNDGTGQLEIRLVSDNGLSMAYEHDAVGDGETSIPLSMLSGQAATISFKAIMGDVYLKEARILQRGVSSARPPRIAAVKNLLIVVIDTLRRDRLKAYDSKTNVHAPGLRRFGEQSIVFQNAVAQSNWTKPSTATLLTGLYPSIHSANTHIAVLPRTATTLPVLLKKEGFTTGGFVANGYITAQFGFGEGWDHFEMYDTKNDPVQGRRMFPDLIRWIKERPKNQRYFAYVHTTDVHAPYRSPRYVWSRYDPTRYRGAILPKQTVGLLNRVRAGSVFLAQRDLFRLIALYNGAISYHDQSVDRLMKTLKQSGVLDDTVVVLTSDHGEEFLEHGSLGHGHTLHRELVNVPLMMRLPDGIGIPPRPIREMVGLVDMAPTLCDLLHVECPSSIQGVSALPLVTGHRRIQEKEAIVSESPSHHAFALQNANFKAIITNNRMSLYDKRKDSFETDDQSQDYPIACVTMVDILNDHLCRLAAWRHQFSDSKLKKGAETGADIDDETKARLRALGYVDD